MYTNGQKTLTLQIPKEGRPRAQNRSQPATCTCLLSSLPCPLSPPHTLQPRVFLLGDVEVVDIDLVCAVVDQSGAADDVLEVPIPVDVVELPALADLHGAAGEVVGEVEQHHQLEGRPVLLQLVGGEAVQGRVGVARVHRHRHGQRQELQGDVGEKTVETVNHQVFRVVFEEVYGERGVDEGRRRQVHHAERQREVLLLFHLKRPHLLGGRAFGALHLPKRPEPRRHASDAWLRRPRRRGHRQPAQPRGPSS
mmetsp:Transcript_2983/g.6755  ORF Transcript_2983/g.6755 Transcript_2983/m.6755 type:complete len:252 (-) Transcript_2983:989-1744(-)